MIVKRLGPVAYDLTLEAMRAFTAARDERHGRRVWLCEHPPVFTQGLAGKAGARARRRRDPGGSHRPRRPGHVPRARPGRRLPAGRPAPARHLRQGIRVPARAGAAEDARGLRRHRPSRARRSRASTSALDDPFGHARAAAGERRRRTRSTGWRRSPRSASRSAAIARITASPSTSRWTCGPSRGIDPCGLCRAEDGRSFYNRRSRHVGRVAQHPRRQAARLPEPRDDPVPRPRYDATQSSRRPRPRPRASRSSIVPVAEV